METFRRCIGLACARDLLNPEASHEQQERGQKLLRPEHVRGRRLDEVGGAVAVQVERSASNPNRAAGDLLPRRAVARLGRPVPATGALEAAFDPDGEGLEYAVERVGELAEGIAAADENVEDREDAHADVWRGRDVAVAHGRDRHDR